MAVTKAPTPISNVDSAFSAPAAKAAAPAGAPSALQSFYGATPSAPAASPAAGAAPTVNFPQITPNNNYQQAYANALATARSGVAAQVQSALAESQREQAAGNSQLGTLAPAVNDITNAGRATLGGIANSADATQRASGLGSFTSGAQEAQPAINEMGQYQQFTKDATPLISQGIADQASQRQAAINQYQMEMNEQIAQQQAGYDQQASLAQMQIQSNREQAEWARQNQLTDMSQTHKWDVTAAATAATNQAKLYGSIYGQNSQVNPSTGITYGQQNTIEKTPVYQRYVKGLQSGELDPTQTFRYLSSHNPQLLSTIADSGTVPSLSQLYKAGGPAPVSPPSDNGGRTDAISQLNLGPLGHGWAIG